MSYILSLNGKSSYLENRYFPYIELDGEYECGLLDLVTYHSIPNIEEGVNNIFHIGKHEIKLPTGSYEIEDINDYIKDYLMRKDSWLDEVGKVLKIPGDKVAVHIKANKNTLKTEIISTENIYFDKPNSIADLLGFKKEKLAPNLLHISDETVKITKVNMVHVECDIIDGTYQNKNKSNTIYQFPIDVAPGFKIVQKPTNIVYLKVNTNQLTSLRIRLLDQQERPINLREEEISVRLHLKKVK